MRKQRNTTSGMCLSPPGSGNKKETVKKDHLKSLETRGE
jgi:hypothetical protein